MPRRYDVEKLTGRNDLVNDFEVKLGGAFAPLLDLDPEDVETMYDGFKEATNSTTERTVGFKGSRGPATVYRGGLRTKTSCQV